MALPDWLTRKLGPLPVGVWAAAIGGGLALSYALQRRSRAAEEEASTEEAPAEPQAPLWPDAGSVGYGLATPLPTGSQVVSVTSGTRPPETNSEWQRLVSIELQARGIGALEGDTATRKYLAGQTLTSGEAAIIDIALRIGGPPPEGVAPAEVDRPPSAPPTTPATPTPPPTQTSPPPPSPKPPKARPDCAKVGPNKVGTKGGLSLGASGGWVCVWQKQLNDQRGAGLVEDAKFGSRTDAATRKFQKDMKLKTDGIVGSQTVAAMERLYGVR